MTGTQRIISIGRDSRDNVALNCAAHSRGWSTVGWTDESNTG